MSGPTTSSAAELSNVSVPTTSRTGNEPTVTATGPAFSGVGSTRDAHDAGVAGEESSVLGVPDANRPTQDASSRSVDSSPTTSEPEASATTVIEWSVEPNLTPGALSGTTPAISETIPWATGTTEDSVTTVAPSRDGCDDVLVGGQPPGARPDVELFPPGEFIAFDAVEVHAGCVIAAVGELKQPVSGRGREHWNFAGELLEEYAPDLYQPVVDDSAILTDGRRYETSHSPGSDKWSQLHHLALNSGQPVWINTYDEYGWPRDARLALAGGYVAAVVSYQDEDYVDRGLIDWEELAVYLHRRDGELVWRARILTDSERPTREVTFDIDVSESGEVLFSGAYENVAFVQSRSVGGEMHWHRTFPELPALSEVHWTNRGQIVVAGSWPQGNAISVRQLTKEGADVWRRDIYVAQPHLGDLALDSRDNIYVAGRGGNAPDSTPILARVNAEQFTVVADGYDGGIPGWQSNDPDEGKVHPPASKKCAQIAHVRGFFNTSDGLERLPVHTIETFEVCSRETVQVCTLLDGGELAVPPASPGLEAGVISSGCWLADLFHNGSNASLDGCCFADSLTQFSTPSCADELREGMHCTLEDRCTQGRCVNGTCSPDAPVVCDDGNFCNGQEWCDPEVGCRTSFSPAFDDNACTVDSCNEASGAVSHVDPVAPGGQQCIDCFASTQVYAAEAVEDFWSDEAVPTITLAEMGCGDVVEHCGRTANGEWYVASELGDPLTLPVSEGCAVHRWTVQRPFTTTILQEHHVQKCCVGEVPFMAGERVGDSEIVAQ